MSERYYVWFVDGSGRPLRGEGPYGPMTLTRARTFARIGATEGDHDRLVTRGKRTGDIVRHYEAGTGERLR